MSNPSQSPEIRSPLHGFDLNAQAKPIDASCGVWANEAPLQGYISLRGETADARFAEAVAKGLSINLPAEPCTFAAAGPVKVLWLSPDEWMIVCPRDRLAVLLRDLRTALDGVRSQVTDNSGGYTQVVVEGSKAAEILTHATVYDLVKLTSGRVVGTTFGKSSLYMHRQGEGYCLLLRRSFADYIWRYLVRAAQPYGFGVARSAGPSPKANGAAP